MLLININSQKTNQEEKIFECAPPLPKSCTVHHSLPNVPFNFAVTINANVLPNKFAYPQIPQITSELTGFHTFANWTQTTVGYGFAPISSPTNLHFALTGTFYIGIEMLNGIRIYDEVWRGSGNVDYGQFH